MIDKSKNMRIKKELKSYISTFDDKVSDKENEEIANILLEKYNTDKDFNKKVEKISKKLQSSTSTLKKGGRRKTRKKQKGGMTDEAIAILAGAIILTTGLVSVFAYGIQRYMNFRERGDDLVRQNTISGRLRTTSSSDDDNDSRFTTAFTAIPPHSQSGSNYGYEDAFAGEGNTTLPILSRPFNNRTGEVFNRLDLVDEEEFQNTRPSTPQGVIRRGVLNPNTDNQGELTEDHVLSTPQVNLVGRYGLRRRAATAPPVMDNSTTTSSSDENDEDFYPLSPALLQLQRRSDSDSESPERPPAGRHHSAGGGRKRKTLRKRKKRRKKITIKRK